MATFRVNGVLQASYKYDFARRQVVRALSGGATIHLVFDADGNRIAEYDQTSGALIREYVWFEGAAVAVIEARVVYYIRSDHIGRPVFATNAAGVQVWAANPVLASVLGRSAPTQVSRCERRWQDLPLCGRGTGLRR